jgi:hypothetical protein
MAGGEVRKMFRRGLLVALRLFLPLVALAGAFVAVDEALPSPAMTAGGPRKGPRSGSTGRSGAFSGT